MIFYDLWQTIKFTKAAASQLFKRLSPYARDNPFYQVLKEFGRVIKSLFILTYFDDIKLRQRIGLVGTSMAKLAIIRCQLHKLV